MGAQLPDADVYDERAAVCRIRKDDEHARYGLSHLDYYHSWDYIQVPYCILGYFGYFIFTVQDD